jgi:hypothetical protein
VNSRAVGSGEVRVWCELLEARRVRVLLGIGRGVLLELGGGFCRRGRRWRSDWGFAGAAAKGGGIRRALFALVPSRLVGNRCARLAGGAAGTQASNGVLGRRLCSVCWEHSAGELS